MADHKAFTLLEVLISIALMGIVLVALLGLVACGGGSRYASNGGSAEKFARRYPKSAS